MARIGGKPLTFGAAEAMIVATARDGGIAGAAGGGKEMGASSDDVLHTIDRLTGGAVTDVNQQLEDLKLYLKISIACSIFAGLCAFGNLLRERR